MLSLDDAVETHARNSPSGLLESAFEGLIFSTSARYSLASVVSPDLIDDIELESALSKGFWLLGELDAAEIDDVERSVNGVLLSMAEIDMMSYPLAAAFS